MKLFAGLFLCFALAANASSAIADPTVPAAPASAAAKPALTIAVVPFEEPGGDTIDTWAADDHNLQAKVQERGATAVMTQPMRHLDIPKSAATICKTTGAQAILVGSTRTEQNLKVTYAVLTDITHYPTHAELRLTALDCMGHVLWRTVTTGDRDYYWSNVGAAVSETAAIAIDRAVTDMPLPLPTVALPIAALAPAAASANIVVLPVSEPGSEDGLLDETTTQLFHRVQAVDATAALAPAMDRFDAINNASAICAAYHAKGLMFASVRTEQTVRTGLKSHAEIFASMAGCDGSVLWTERQTAENTHFGANFRSGASAAIVSAFDAMDAKLATDLKTAPAESAAH